MKQFELPTVNGRKSFNGKAIVKEVNEVIYLYSYDTLVAEFNRHTNTILVHGYHSLTTGTHINAFLSFYGFETMTKKEIFSTYNINQ